MTSRSRRKHRTTAWPTTRPRTALSLAVLAALAGGPAGAQAPPGRPAAPPGSGGRVMYFHKEANALGTADAPGSGVRLAQATAPADAPPPVRPAVAQGAQPDVVPAPPPYTVQRKQDLPKAQPVPASVTRLPGRDKIFIMYDDTDLERVIVRSIQEQYAQAPLTGLRFPEPSPLVPDGTTYEPKTAQYPPLTALYEPTYVVHRRLHFEEKNAERYGWDLGAIQPVVSAMYFWKDALFLPNSLASGFEIGFWDTSAGKCLPGVPVPYYLYPPNVTVTGLLTEAGVITGSAYILRPLNGAPGSIAAAAAGQ